MPPDEECPICHQKIQDWHFERYDKPEQSALYRGVAAMDCPRCGGPVGFQQGTIGPAPSGVLLVRRRADKAAAWAPLGAAYAGGNLAGYLSKLGPGQDYSTYWSAQEVQQADADERAKTQGP